MLKTFKLIAVSIFILSLCSVIVFGQKKVIHPIKPKDFDGLGITNDFKILAQGSQSKVETPFVFIARDETSYLQLQSLVEGLPSSIDFKKNVVVAGFAGERSTGGWSVEIRKSDKKVLIDLTAPRKDMMVTQVITTPFKVSLIPIDENGSSPIDVSPSYLKNAENYRVTKGDFEFSGGFAGIHKKFKANGTIKMVSFGENITLLFDLIETGKKGKRKLSEIASGTLKNDKIELSKLDSGSFIDKPDPFYKAVGILKNKRLSLSFESLPSTFADGYVGKGNLEAIRTK